MFCAPGLVFDSTEGVGSHFHVLRSRTRFRRYGGRRVTFSCFPRPDSFSAEIRVPGAVFMFCAPGVVSLDTEGVGSRFQVLTSQTCFLQYCGHRVPFSYFARSNSFSAIPKASGLVFMFCTPGLIFGGTEGVWSRFHVLRFRTHFRRYRGRPVPFSYFVLSDSFSAVPRTSATVFMFCASGLIFGGTKGVESCFHVFRSRNRFRWC
jgi:hypothetical protein